MVVCRRAVVLHCLHAASRCNQSRRRSMSRAATPLHRHLHPLLPIATLLFGACGVPSGQPSSSPAQATGGAALQPALGSASPFAILGASTVTCTNTSIVTGDVG